jgi:hypothetical protein
VCSSDLNFIGSAPEPNLSHPLQIQNRILSVRHYTTSWQIRQGHYLIGACRDTLLTYLLNKNIDHPSSPFHSTGGYSGLKSGQDVDKPVAEGIQWISPS